MDYLNDLYELCETITREIADANEKIRSAGGKISASDMDYIDKLTHSLKSIKGVEAMAEAESDGEYSGRAYPMMGGSYRGGSYARGGSYRGGSYARGRGGNVRRDSMGRYSSGYSRDGGMVEELRELMPDAPDERTRQEFQRFIQKIESM